MRFFTRLMVCAVLPMLGGTIAVTVALWWFVAPDLAPGRIAIIWALSGSVVAVAALGTAAVCSWAIRPLRRLAADASLALGRAGTAPLIGADSDEVATIRSVLETARSRISRLADTTATARDLERELDQAQSIARAMTPARGSVEYGTVSLAGVCLPVSHCGGDWWMYRQLGNGSVLLLVGDVTGHGVHAALVAGAARGAVEALAAVDERLLVPEYVLLTLHAATLNIGDHDLRMACFAATIDQLTGAVSYANAGQPFPYLLRQQGESFSAQRVVARSSVLGESTGKPTPALGTLRLQPGDTMVCLTDGVFGCSTSEGHTLNERRLALALQDAHIHDTHDTATTRDRLLARVHPPSSELRDDMTLVLCRYQPPQTTAEPQSGPTRLWTTRTERRRG
jgi:phosphoserine phosphatase RsbU/P